MGKNQTEAEKDRQMAAESTNGARQIERQRDANLLVGVRRNEPHALRAFVLRFRPILLDQARRLGVNRSERATVVLSFLDDILVKLAHSVAPRSLPSFVVTSFRNCVTDMHRELEARERQSCAQEEMVGSEFVIRAGCSEYMLRAVRPPDAEDDSSPLASTELVTALFTNCSFEDRQLLVWSAHRVPLRYCAAWLGISYDSAKQRLTRLRARLVRQGVAHLKDISVPDRVALTRLLHRAGVTIDDDNTGGSAA